MEWLKALQEKLAAIGLNVMGVADGSPYAHLLEGCESAVVVGNGGRTLWEYFVQTLEEDPSRLSEHSHPFDDMVERWIEKISVDVGLKQGEHFRWIRCAATEETFVDFRCLGRDAGLGSSSPVGLLIHPEYGLWFGLRAVLLTTEKLDAHWLHNHPKPTLNVEGGAESPCSRCVEKPCISACPAKAVQVEGWSVQRCATFHQTSSDCAGRCHSRLACPVGREHRHSALQHLYHNDPVYGRRVLAATLGLQDVGEGTALDWEKWSGNR